MLNKIKDVRFLVLSLILAGVASMIGLSGCATADNQGLMDEPQTWTNNILPRISVGDTVTVTISGLDVEVPPMIKPIKDDGTISLPDVGEVQAAGKTPGELEAAIHNLYVPKIYTHINITVVLTSDRVYFVRGEVKQPSRELYTGPVTVTRAIASAGDFTDFANHKNVVLIRSNGKRYTIDCDRILDGDDPDPPVYPGDQIVVKRRFL